MSYPTTHIDGYKLGHLPQYPDFTERVQVNWTSRSSRIPGQEDVVVLGNQRAVRLNFMERWGEFFAGDIDREAKRFARRVNGYLGPNSVGVKHLHALHEIGYLPLEVSALPEGSVAPLGIPHVLIENSPEVERHKEFFWLPNYLETIFSCEMWLPSTSATTALRFRRLIEQAAIDTGSPLDFVDFQAHDFSMRGMAGLGAAEMSGMGHLLYFLGTDTMPAIDMIEDYYNPASDPLPDDYLIGASVAATEHSVMCAGGMEDELSTYKRLINKVYPEGIVSIVSDTWDYWAVLTEHLPMIKDMIMERDGKVVIRPDSGDPVKIIVGDPDALPGTPEHKGSIEILWEIFGGTETETGHKLLDGHIGLIYGDSITEARAAAIINGLYAKGFASGNVVFGIGSYTYQYVTRDVYGYAMKATWVQIDGEGKAIFKDPKTGDGTKKSAKGRLAVLRTAVGGMALVNEATEAQEANSLLRPVWRNGEFLIEENFATVRDRARSYV